MNYVDGNIYKGEWKNDKINGLGKYTFASGQIYDGERVDGKKIGYG